MGNVPLIDCLSAMNAQHYTHLKLFGNQNRVIFHVKYHVFINEEITVFYM